MSNGIQTGQVAFNCAIVEGGLVYFLVVVAANQVVQFTERLRLIDDGGPPSGLGVAAPGGNHQGSQKSDQVGHKTSPRKNPIQRKYLKS